MGQARIKRTTDDEDISVDVSHRISTLIVECAVLNRNIDRVHPRGAYTLSGCTGTTWARNKHERKTTLYRPGCDGEDLAVLEE